MTQITQDILDRINQIYAMSNPQEQKYLYQILEEFAKYGYSQTYDDIWLADYIEIPVSVNTFLTSDNFLGKVTRQGEGVYPYWKHVLQDIFTAGNRYDECIFTGATRIGKTSTAITGASYMLYRLMCLRDPHKFFGIKEESKISILFFNITKDLAKGVAYREFNDTLKASPWFNSRGKFSKSDQNFYYIPDGGKVTIDYGSDSSHALGKQVFCLVGDTLILTDDGPVKLSDKAGCSVNVWGVTPDYDVCLQHGYIVLSKYATDTVLLHLSNGAKIEGTEDHRLMTTDGNYVSLKDIQVGQYLMFDKVISKIHITHDIPIPVYDVVNAEPYHNFMISTEDSVVISHNCAIMDECNFSKSGVKDINKAKASMMDTYNTISARIKGTFRKNGEVYGKMFAVSSKKSDSDFIESHVQTQMASGAGAHMYVVDKPQWEILPPSRFHSETFAIAVGDRHHKGFVVPDNQNNEESLSELKSQGYTIMNPPIDMRPEFIADFDIALRDLAGVSVPGALSFITQEMITSVITDKRRNPFINDILQIGTRDSFAIEDYFHMEYVDKSLISSPVYIHLDLSLNTDKSGISAVCVPGKKAISYADGRNLYMSWYAHLFSVSLQAPRGDKIPYDRVVQFICWLRRNGFNIKLVSRDQYQSEYLAQILEAQNFKTSKISLDRTPDGYLAFRSVIQENRIELLDCQLLQNELIQLQRDSISGKIDHPLGGSKDMADSVAGAVWDAINDNPEPAHNARSSVKTISTVNRITSINKSIDPFTARFINLR